MKPLGQKSYGSIPHLPGSRLGEGDHHCSPGQAKIATEKKRDKHDLIIVQEKLDGSNCCVAKIGSRIHALGRAGYLATSSNYPIHHVFNKWVMENEGRFLWLLNEGERVCGEFLAQAVGTKYRLPHEPFVAFDLMTKNTRVCYNEFVYRVQMYDFIIPKLLSIGEPFSIEAATEAIKISGHGAIDEVEGAIWRVERKGAVDFLCKFVKHHKQDGKYFPELNNGQIIWNIDIKNYEDCFKNLQPV